MSQETFTELVGWLAAGILLATMMRQVWTQWRTRTVAGVSRWLFVGQCAASLGFTVYSALLGNVVFVVTNAVMLANALLGLWIDRRNRRLQSSAPTDGARDVAQDGRVSSTPSSAR